MPKKKEVEKKASTDELPESPVLEQENIAAIDRPKPAHDTMRLIPGRKGSESK